MSRDLYIVRALLFARLDVEGREITEDDLIKIARQYGQRRAITREECQALLGRPLREALALSSAPTAAVPNDG